MLIHWLDRFQDGRWTWKEADWKTVGQLRRRLVERLKDDAGAGPDILFFRCDSGWIGFLVVAGDQYVEVQASDYHDPFPGLLVWLEQVADDGFPAPFPVNEEHGYVWFELRRRGDLAVFRVYEGDISVWLAPGGELLIETAVASRSLAAAFYRELRRFARESFDPFEWAGTTIAEELSHTRADFRRADIWTLDRADLLKFIERHVPEGWINSDKLDRMEISTLRAWIREAFDDSIHGWGGSDLRFLRSEKLEALIGAVSA